MTKSGKNSASKRADDRNGFEGYLTVKDVAQILKVSERTVRRRIASGELQAFKDGRVVRVRRDHLRAYELQRLFR